MSNLPTKQDILNKATKCMIVNKEVAKTIERKTMTRRVVKVDIIRINEELDITYFCKKDNVVKFLQNSMFIEKFAQYKVGDIGWCREPAEVIAFDNETLELCYRFKADDGINAKSLQIPSRFYKKQSDGKIDYPLWAYLCRGVPNGCIKEMARYFFEITAVKVERLQDITLEDILKEGCHIRNSQMYQDDIREWFIKLWDSTAKAPYRFNDKPFYVFVYEYEMIEYAN